MNTFKVDPRQGSLKTPKSNPDIARLPRVKKRASQVRHPAGLLLAVIYLTGGLAPPGYSWNQQVSSQCEIAPDANAIDVNKLDHYERVGHKSPAKRRSGGIREVIPQKYVDRYQKWKKEFLASEIGRRQWERYAHHPHLILTITFSAQEQKGAMTCQLEWNDSGALIGATIALGRKLDRGYPNPVYYPVLGSLKRLKSEESGKILAAAKLAHEFGHVDQASSGGVRYWLQSEIVPAYNKILLSNGYDARDPRLIELAREMGGTPVELSEEREYSAEENTMRYLLDRINGVTRRRLLSSVKRTVQRYAKNFERRFNQIADQQSSASGR